MYLSRLEVFGFKTFAQKVDLRFDEGITNIVGPNGCGKSNVVDALRWSLGEQKASILRSEKMENVIFNGTKQRKPLNFAEVSLTIQNTKGILPTEYTEVTITRRIYRSGESEYFLNRLPCRLKDINDLFMDTGMGADAYSVIELKMVEQILSDKTEDRRKMFEEAAGITKYKIRRRQTFNKLQTTKLDLNRANDIIVEIEKKVNSLKRQTQKAKRHMKLSARLKLAEVQLAHHEYQKFAAQLAPMAEKLENLEFVAEQMLGEISKKEAEVEAMNTGLIEREQSLRAIQLQLEEQDKKIKTIEDEILVSRERKKNLEAMIGRYAEEKTALEAKREQLQARITELSATLADLESQYNGMSGTVEAKKTEMLEFDQQIQAKRTELDTVRKQSVQLIDEVAKKRNAFQLTKNNIQNIERKIADLHREGEFHNTSSEDAISALDEKRYEKKKLGEQVEALRNKITADQSALDTLRHTLDDLRSKKLHDEAEIKALHAKMAIIQKAIENHEGFPESVQYILSSKPSGIQATVADMIATDDTYKKAIETALGDSFAYLVAGGSDHVHDALTQLNTNKKGSATFLNRQKIGQFKPAFEAEALASVRGEIIGMATELVRCDDPAMARLLLSDVVIVENFEKATRLADQFPAVRFVTLQGEIVKGNYLIKGGGTVKSSDSLIGQREALNKLQDQLSQYEASVRRYQDELQTTDTTLRELTQTIANNQNLLKNTEQKFVALEKEIAQSEYEQKRSRESLTRNEDALLQAQREMEAFQLTIEDMGPEMDELEGRRGSLELETRRMEQQLAELEKQRRERSEGFNEMISSFLRMEGEIKTNRNNIESSRTQIADIEATILRREEETVAAENEIARMGDVFTEREGELITLSRERDVIERNRDAEGTEVARLRETTGKIEAELKKMRRQREEFLNSRHTMEQETTNLRFELRALEERIKRDHDFDLTKDSIETLILSTEPGSKEEESEEDAPESAPDTAPQEVSGVENQEMNIDEVLESDLVSDASQAPETASFDPEATKLEIDELRRKLKSIGPVNMEAFAEFQTEKERLDVLLKQRQDLLDAEAQLLETINAINEQAQKQFMEVFEKIRANFIKIFTGLFVDSEADLKLEANEDILEANIDILARPTGKKIQHIQLLSGGEKTLTAISLLFAIYLVKPSPFCILDEVDAPLDDTNIDKFTKILKDFSKDTQFIVVTHNKRTMEAARNIFGITMQEAGVSKVVSVKFSNRGDVSKTDDIEQFINENQVEDLTKEVKDTPPSPSVA